MKHVKKAVMLGLIATSTFLSLSAQNGVLSFDGVDDYVNLGDTAGDGIRTVELWFMPAENITSSLTEFQSLVMRNNGQTVNNGETGLIFRNVGGNSGKLSFSVRDGSGTEHAVYSNSNTWNKNQWYHVAGVIHPNQGMALYIDGIKQTDTNTYTSPTEDILTDMYAGTWGDELVRFFKGSMDDIHFASDALYTSNFTPPCPDRKAVSSSVGLWNFSGNNATTATDSSGLGNDGIISGASRVVITNFCDPSSSGKNLTHASNNLVLYPNPSNGVFTFEIEDKSLFSRKLEIINAVGQTIYSSTFMEWSHTVDLSSYNAGLYHYRLEEADITHSGNLLLK